MNKRLIYHNELYFKVQRPVKRRFVEICREQGRYPSEVLEEITKAYVFEHTPTTKAGKITYDINNWFNNNATKLYNFYVGLCFMMIGAIFLLFMRQMTTSFETIVGFMSFFVIILIFSKIFFLLGKKK